MHAMERRIRINSSLATRFIKVYAFNLHISLTHQSRLVSDNFTIFISLVLEDPLGVDYMRILGPWYQLPYIISNKLMQLLVHGFYPILILQSFLHFLWFKLSKIAVVCHMTCTIGRSFS